MASACLAWPSFRAGLNVKMVLRFLSLPKHVTQALARQGKQREDVAIKLPGMGLAMLVQRLIDGERHTVAELLARAERAESRVAELEEEFMVVRA